MNRNLVLGTLVVLAAGCSANDVGPSPAEMATKKAAADARERDESEAATIQATRSHDRDLAVLQFRSYQSADALSDPHKELAQLTDRLTDVNKRIAAALKEQAESAPQFKNARRPENAALPMKRIEALYSASIDDEVSWRRLALDLVESIGNRRERIANDELSAISQKDAETRAARTEELNRQLEEARSSRLADEERFLKLDPVQQTRVAAGVKKLKAGEQLTITEIISLAPLRKTRGEDEGLKFDRQCKAAYDKAVQTGLEELQQKLQGWIAEGEVIRRQQLTDDDATRKFESEIKELAVTVPQKRANSARAVTDAKATFTAAKSDLEKSLQKKLDVALALSRPTTAPRDSSP